MMDLTQQQEQEMIERAKAGDPEANYQMSLWALDQAIAEPEEERWNRLAAKCLVKAAEAGYEPAKAKMEELLAQSPETQAAAVQPAPAQPAAVTQQAEPAPQDYTPSAPQPDTAQTAAVSGASGGGFSAKLTAALAAVKTAAGSVGEKLKGLFAGKKTGTDTPAAGTEAAPAPSGDGKKGGLFNFSQWDDAKWKKMQIICIVICAILVLLIIISLATRNKQNDNKPAEVLPSPEAEVIVTPEPTMTPEPVLYPDEATRTEIAGSNLEIKPEDEDYVDAPKIVTVSTSGSGLNLRKGPGSQYAPVDSMDNGTTVDVYAYKNGWALVKYNEIWGWCSVDYLK